MTPEEVAELNWDTKLPFSLIDAVTALERALENYLSSELGDEFLHMYVNSKKLEAKQAAEKTEKERLDVFSRKFSWKIIGLRFTWKESFFNR